MLAKSVKCLRSGRSAARSGCSLGGSFSHFGPPDRPEEDGVACLADAQGAIRQCLAVVVDAGAPDVGRAAARG